MAYPDSVLLEVDKIVQIDPRLKFAPCIALSTFAALLQTNPDKAYEYGKKAIVTPVYDEPPYGFIIGDIEWHFDKLKLPAEIYLLGAEAYEMKIKNLLYPQLVDNMPDFYHKMAAWYWRGGNKSKAIEAEKGVIQNAKKYFKN